MKFNWQIKMDQVPRMLAEMLTVLTVSELIPWFAFEGRPTSVLSLTHGSGLDNREGNGTVGLPDAFSSHL